MAIFAALSMAFSSVAAMPETPREKLEKAGPEIREAICTVGVETLEDNAISLELLKKVPKDKVIKGLKAIKEHLKMKKMLPHMDTK